MRLAAAISDVERAETLEELDLVLQSAIENIGFRAFNFLDVGPAHLERPYFCGTTGHRWEAEYAQNEFVRFDPAISKARRSNLPFNWESVKLATTDGRARSKTHEVMVAAHDHGFSEGLVVPHHFIDEIGRFYSCLTVLFWSENVEEYHRVLGEYKYDLNILLFYFMARKHNLLQSQNFTYGNNKIKPKINFQKFSLSDRERDVLSWASRGKTSKDTSEILNISVETVDTHLTNARRKLGATNKSHAIALAIMNGVIDP